MLPCAADAPPAEAQPRHSWATVLHDVLPAAAALWAQLPAWHQFKARLLGLRPAPAPTFLACCWAKGDDTGVKLSYHRGHTAYVVGGQVRGRL